MTDLAALSTELSRIVSLASSSVVRVDARRRAPSSGVVFADGVVVTTHHALEREDNIFIEGSDGRRVSAELAGRDASTDLAVLKTETKGLQVAAWDDGTSLAVGQLILAVARPEGLAATLGIVRSLGDAWRTHAGGKIDRFLEADLDLPTGFSGGLLISASGRSLGVNTSGLARNRNLTLPASTVRRVVESLLARGSVQRGYLGLGSHPIRLPAKLAAETGQESALIVVSVQPEGPSEKAGVLIGDVLLNVDGTRTTDVGELVGLLEEDRIGKEVTLRVVRAGEMKDVRVTVGARSWS